MGALPEPDGADGADGASPVLACALASEERAARKGGANAARVGLGAGLPLPAGPLIAFGLAGALVRGLEPGLLVTAGRVVDEGGDILWEGEPVQVPKARVMVLCAAARVVDRPEERAALAESTGALAVDLESGRLAASGRLVGVVRAISDGPDRPVGRLARAATPEGDVDWQAVAGALAREPVRAIAAAAAARKALASLELAAAALAPPGRSGAG